MTRHADVLKKDLQEVNGRLYFFLVKVKVKSLSHVRLFATPWTVAYQAPPSMGFSRQEYWSGLPFPSPHNSLLKDIVVSQNIFFSFWSLFSFIGTFRIRSGSLAYMLRYYDYREIHG